MLRGPFRGELMVERGDGGGLAVQAGELGWNGGEQGRRWRRDREGAGADGRRGGKRGRVIPASWRGPHSGRSIGGWGEKDQQRSARINQALEGLKRLTRGQSAAEDDGDWMPEGGNSGVVYSAVKRGLDHIMAAPASSSLEAEVQQVSGVSGSASPSVLAALASYIGVALHEQTSLTKALERRPNLPRRAHQIHGSGGSLQYGLSLTDEYDGLPQSRQRRFAEGDAPKLQCPGQEVGRHADCTLGQGKEYNRMFYLDRRLSNTRASQADIRREVQGVKTLTDQWRHLLVGAGGGSGEPGSFDSPYYFCYSNYQEDPEVVSPSFNPKPCLHASMGL